jgi:hypothetical protein
MNAERRTGYIRTKLKEYAGSINTSSVMKGRSVEVCKSNIYHL